MPSYVIVETTPAHKNRPVRERVYYVDPYPEEELETGRDVARQLQDQADRAGRPEDRYRLCRLVDVAPRPVGGIPEPTHQECTDHAPVGPGVAVWYPQMGGYRGKAVVVLDGEGHGCCDVYVWHDGNFPINSADQDAPNPAVLHHCNGQQFIEFGMFLVGLARVPA